MDDCIFCKIARGDMEGDIVYEDDQVVAFRDINPMAPTHVLVVPREHMTSFHDLPSQEPALAAHIMEVCSKVAEMEGITGSGVRVITNAGKEAGQVVMHLHFHVLGGRKMGWPPG